MASKERVQALAPRCCPASGEATAHRLNWGGSPSRTSPSSASSTRRPSHQTTALAVEAPVDAFENRGPRPGHRRPPAEPPMPRRARRPGGPLPRRRGLPAGGAGPAGEAGRAKGPRRGAGARRGLAARTEEGSALRADLIRPECAGASGEPSSTSRRERLEKRLQRVRGLSGRTEYRTSARALRCRRRRQCRRAVRDPATERRSPWGR